MTGTHDQDPRRGRRKEILQGLLFLAAFGLLGLFVHILIPPGARNHSAQTPEFPPPPTMTRTHPDEETVQPLKTVPFTNPSSPGSKLIKVVSGSSSQPLSGARVFHVPKPLTPISDAESLGTTDSLGTALLPAEGTIYVLHSRHSPVTIPSIQTLKGSGQLNIVAMRPCGVLLGRLVDFQDRPMPGVKVIMANRKRQAVSHAETEVPVEDQPTRALAVTDSQGRFRCSSLPVGRASIEICLPYAYAVDGSTLQTEVLSQVEPPEKTIRVGTFLVGALAVSGVPSGWGCEVRLGLPRGFRRMHKVRSGPTTPAFCRPNVEESILTLIREGLAADSERDLTIVPFILVQDSKEAGSEDIPAPIPATLRTGMRDFSIPPVAAVPPEQWKPSFATRFTLPTTGWIGLTDLTVVFRPDAASTARLQHAPALELFAMGTDVMDHPLTIIPGRRAPHADGSVVARLRVVSGKIRIRPAPTMAWAYPRTFREVTVDAFGSDQEFDLPLDVPVATIRLRVTDAFGRDIHRFGLECDGRPPSFVTDGCAPFSYFGDSFRARVSLNASPGEPAIIRDIAQPVRIGEDNEVRVQFGEYL